MPQGNQRSWKFEPDDLLAEEIPALEMPGAEGVGLDDHDLEVIKRVWDADGGTPLYCVEDTEGQNTVYTATLIETNYEKVGEADTDD